MDRLLSELTDWLIHNHAISSDDKELYEYAIYSFIISTVPLVIFLVIKRIQVKLLATQVWEVRLLTFRYSIKCLLILRQQMIHTILKETLWQ